MGPAQDEEREATTSQTSPFTQPKTEPVQEGDSQPDER